MLTPRRLTAALVATALGWSVLATGLVGSPAQADPPTYGGAVAQRAPHDPATYYAGTDGLSGAPLAAKLHTIILGHTKLSYAAVYDALPITDVDPSNSANLIDFYSGTSVAATNRCGSSCPTLGWNREHTWPQSHGGFGTSAGIGTDLFHMRPEFGSTNSSRGNLDFDNTTSGTVPDCVDCRRDSDSFEPRAAVKGDLARGLFYLAVRYEGDNGELNLKMNDLTCNGSGAPNMGKLSTLISWSLADPPDARERARNDLIDGTYQHNRNPFIDHPEWVSSIFGSGTGQGPACGSTSGTEYVPGGTAPVNTAPTASPTSTTTLEDTTVTTTLTGSDADGDPLTWSVTQAPTKGTASISGSTLTYVPTADLNGTDQVGVRVSDGRGGTATTTVTITVTPVNDAPVATNQVVDTTRGTAKQVTLVATDVDDAASTLTYAAATQPSHGTVAVSGAVATYTPTAGYTGPDSFTYVARDPAGASSTPATVTVTVTTPPQQPTASDSSVTTTADQPVTTTLSGTGPAGATLTYAVASTPAHGTVQLAGSRATYTPAAGYTGPDSFTFTVSDGTTTSAPATVSITVRAPLVATGSSVTTAADQAVTTTLSGSGPAGATLTYAVASTPAHGTVQVSGNRATYTPATGYAGPDSFTFTVSDGTSTSAPATVNITVTAPPQAPPTANGSSISTTADQPVTTTLSGSGPAGATLTYAVASTPAHGTVQLTGNQATYTPAGGYTGPDSFTFTVSDGTATSSPATVSVTVSAAPPPPPPPTPPPPAPATLTANATSATTDADGDLLTYALATQPAHGSATLSGTTVTYTPERDFTGSDAFTWTVSDGTTTTTGAASLTVTPVNDAPTVEAVEATTTAGTPVIVTLDVADPDGDPVTISAVESAPGTATFAGATLTYTPAARSGTESFTVVVTDGQGATASAPVRVTIVSRDATLTLATPSATRGTSVTTTIRATGPTGTTPTGRVTLRTSGRTLGSATLRNDGTAVVTWTPTLAGTSSLVASYAGDTVFDPATSPTVRVRVARTTPGLAFTSGTLRQGRAGTLKVAVRTVAGAYATGRLALSVDGRRIVATVTKGVATFRIARLPRVSRMVVSARYSGDGQYAAGTTSHTYRVGR